MNIFWKFMQSRIIKRWKYHHMNMLVTNKGEFKIVINAKLCLVFKMIWTFFYLFNCVYVDVLACKMPMCVHAGAWVYGCVWRPGVNLGCHSSVSTKLVFLLRVSYRFMLTGLGAPGILLSISPQCWELIF